MMTEVEGTARIHSHNVTVPFDNWYGRERHTRLPHEWPAHQCFDSVVCGGVVDPCFPERVMVFADASGRSELKKLEALVERNGGSMQGVTMWRSCWLTANKYGPTSKAGRGWTFPLFMPTELFEQHLTPRKDDRHANLVHGQVLVREEPCSWVKVKAGLGGIETRLAAIHRHRSVPQIATACAEVLVGPQVRSVGGFEVYDDW